MLIFTFFININLFHYNRIKEHNERLKKINERKPGFKKNYYDNIIDTLLILFIYKLGTSKTIDVLPPVTISKSKSSFNPR